MNSPIIGGVDLRQQENAKMQYQQFVKHKMEEVATQLYVNRLNQYADVPDDADCKHMAVESLGAAMILYSVFGYVTLNEEEQDVNSASQED